MKYKTYYQAIAADEAFSKELKRQFGKDAIQARYLERDFPYDEATKSASLAKKEADAALMVAMRR